MSLLLRYVLAVSVVVTVSSIGIPGNMGMDHVGFVVPNVQEATDFFMKAFDCTFDCTSNRSHAQDNCEGTMFETKGISTSLIEVKSVKLTRREVRRDPKPSASERGWDKIFGLHPDSYLPHVVMVKCGDKHLTQYIEFFEFSSPDQYKPSGPENWFRFSDVGNSYTSFTVKDVFATVAFIKEQQWHGVRFIQDPPMQFPLRGEICTSTFMTTPWGQWIELTQWSESGPKGTVIKALRDADTTGTISQLSCAPGDSAVGTRGECSASSDHPDVGESWRDIDTPAFMVDLDAFEHNVKIMRERTVAAGVSWRPPVKAHKSPALAKVLLANGASGILCLKISEAEVFANNGIDDIYVANIIVGKRKIDRLVALARRISKLRVNVDNVDNIRAIAAAARNGNTTIEALVEINIGHNRTGVTPKEAIVLVDAINAESGGLVWVGLTGYEGHTPVLPPEDKTRETIKSHNTLAAAKRVVEAAGHKVEVMTGGGSCNYIDALATGVLNELEAGGGALTDHLYYSKAHLSLHGHKIASFVLTTIVSVPASGDRAIADTGFKSLGWHPFGGLPIVYDRDDLEVFGLSAEHIKIRSKTTGAPVQLKVGEVLRLVPGYIDAMGMLHRDIHAFRGQVVEQVWPILATGKLQ